VLTLVDVPSSVPLSTAEDHQVVVTRQAAEEGLTTLVGMGISCHYSFNSHKPSVKIGVIERAWLGDNNQLLVTGYLWHIDFAGVIKSIRQRGDELGMSFETHQAVIEDKNEAVWVVERLTFTGAAIVYRDKAGYHDTSFTLVEE
jgi:hypothetical protein